MSTTFGSLSNYLMAMGATGAVGPR